ncbi:hypothetical protein Barb6_02734 [Bacteroidales bacterium Barb6]|nr:hypothetical protein Barb6_02734 [Bacteroidales bacterium Barb6]
MEKKQTKTIVHYRDAKSGGYVTKKYAEEHPKTTVRETDTFSVKKK